MNQESQEISGKVALVTGASSGLGLHFAEVLARNGAKVAIAARQVDKLATLADAIRRAGGTAQPFAMDVTSVASIRDVMARIKSEMGSIDILVNNAGLSVQARLEDVEEADYDQVLDTNLKGAFFVGQAAARQMIADKVAGRIVNIASTAAHRVMSQLGPYCISKAAVVQMTHVMAREWGRYGININAISPGYITTNINVGFLATEAGERMIKSLPRRRIGDPSDLDAALLLFCSGEASRSINGSILSVDDGFTSH